MLDSLVEVVLKDDDDFLKIRETLTTHWRGFTQKQNTVSIMSYLA